MSDLETVNKLYLELSNIASAKTAKELKLEQSNKELLEALEKVLSDSECGVVPKSHLNRIEILITNAEREG